jgi:hypothetical protein
LSNPDFAAATPARAPGLSFLRMSALARVAIVLAPLAVLWLAVAWAMR